MHGASREALAVPFRLPTTHPTTHPAPGLSPTSGPAGCTSRRRSSASSGPTRSCSWMSSSRWVLRRWEEAVRAQVPPALPVPRRSSAHDPQRGFCRAAVGAGGCVRRGLAVSNGTRGDCHMLLRAALSLSPPYAAAPGLATASQACPFPGLEAFCRSFSATLTRWCVPTCWSCGTWI